MDGLLGDQDSYAAVRSQIAAERDLGALSDLLESLSAAAEIAYAADDAARLNNLARLWLHAGFRLAHMRIADPDRYSDVTVLDDHTAAVAADISPADFDAVVEMDPPPMTLDEALTLAKARSGRLN